MAPAPYIDPSLDVLRAQLRALHPGVVIYWIGDPAHQAGQSDHNPEADGSVDAIDVMVGPSFSADQASSLAAVLASKSDGRLAYVIWNRRIWTRAAGWQPYTQSNPHTDHVHISRNDANEASRAPWSLTQRKATALKFTVTVPELREGDQDGVAWPGYNMIERVQAIVGATRDGDWGALTTAAIAARVKRPAAECRVLTESLYRALFGLA